MTLAIFGDMCSWTDRETLFVNKEDKSVQIIKREYGCGAWDSGAPMVKDFRVEECLGCFRSTKEIDVESLDKNNWISLVEK